jgi:tryptophanase
MCDLAIPRRVYTHSHVNCVVEAIAELHRRRERLRPYRIVEHAPFL